MERDYKILIVFRGNTQLGASTTSQVLDYALVQNANKAYNMLIAEQEKDNAKGLSSISKIIKLY